MERDGRETAGVWTEIRLRLASRLVSTYDIATDGKRLAALLADDIEAEKLPTHLTFC